MSRLFGIQEFASIHPSDTSLFAHCANQAGIWCQLATRRILHVPPLIFGSKPQSTIHDPQSTIQPTCTCTVAIIFGITSLKSFPPLYSPNKSNSFNVLEQLVRSSIRRSSVLFVIVKLSRALALFPKRSATQSWKSPVVWLEVFSNTSDGILLVRTASDFNLLYVLF